MLNHRLFELEGRLFLTFNLFYFLNQQLGDALLDVLLSLHVGVVGLLRMLDLELGVESIFIQPFLHLSYQPLLLLYVRRCLRLLYKQRVEPILHCVLSPPQQPCNLRPSSTNRHDLVHQEDILFEREWPSK